MNFDTSKQRAWHGWDSNRNVLIVGGGRTGEGVAKLLARDGIEYEIYDERGELPSIDSRFGLAIVSPGWKPTHRLFDELSEKGIPFVSEVDYAWSKKPEGQTWLAVTGTNGKTTTVQMLGAILEAGSLSSVACGNVGLPVSEAVMGDFAYLAIELSSFQIHWSQEAYFESVAILNIAEDHIDWHGSFDSYAEAKMKLLNHCDLAILNLHDPQIALRASTWGGRKIFFSLDTPQAGELGLVEDLIVDRAFTSDPQQADELFQLSDVQPTVPHNVSNAIAAAGIARSIGVRAVDIKRALSRFTVDTHRLELVVEHDGVSWVDDSKATNPHAASASLRSYTSVIWIAGGLAKGASMDELVRSSHSRLKAVLLLGQDRSLIRASLEKYAPSVPVFEFEPIDGKGTMMERIISTAQELAEKGDVVLLAPACASMDQFESYKERGELFASTVRKLVHP
jgi:UDP-N-acetylmuramoylalanine--D-glutamate ligase